MPPPLPHYEVHPGRGPYLLLVHGIISSREQWCLNLAELAEVSRPVVVELLGHGRSPAPAELAAYHPDRYVEAFEQIRAELGAERWIALGQSLGAALTLRYALARPQRLAAHLLTNSSSAFAEPSWEGELRPGLEALLRDVEARGMEALESMRIHPRHGRRLPPEVKARLLADAELHDPRGVALSFIGTAAKSALGDRLESNRVPTLLLCGTREKRFEAHRRRAEKRMPLLEVVELETGHAVNLEAPAEFNRLAKAFVSRHAGAL
ncbi:MAG: alpha/beta hydrolase [Myxococcota bacterium]